MGIFSFALYTPYGYIAIIFILNKKSVRLPHTFALDYRFFSTTLQLFL